MDLAAAPNTSEELLNFDYPSLFDGFTSGAVAAPPPAKKYKGVRERASGKFYAEIKDGRQSRYLGWFNSAEEAARCFDRAAIKLGGNRSLNFPDESWAAPTAAADDLPPAHGSAASSNVTDGSMGRTSAAQPRETSLPMGLGHSKKVVFPRTLDDGTMVGRNLLTEDLPSLHAEPGLVLPADDTTCKGRFTDDLWKNGVDEINNEDHNWDDINFKWLVPIEEFPGLQAAPGLVLPADETLWKEEQLANDNTSRKNGVPNIQWPSYLEKWVAGILERCQVYPDDPGRSAMRGHTEFVGINEYTYELVRRIQEQRVHCDLDPERQEGPLLMKSFISWAPRIAKNIEALIESLSSKFQALKFKVETVYAKSVKLQRFVKNIFLKDRLAYYSLETEKCTQYLPRLFSQTRMMTLELGSIVNEVKVGLQECSSSIYRSLD